MVSDTLSGRPARVSAEKGGAATRLRPKFRERQLPPLNSLAALAQTSAPASRWRPLNFPLRGRPPTERAGSCTNTYQCRAFLRTHIPHEIVRSHGGAGPHTLDTFAAQAVRVQAGGLPSTKLSERAHIKKISYFFMPMKNLCRARARSLVAAYLLMKGRTHMRWKNFLRRRGGSKMDAKKFLPLF